MSTLVRDGLCCVPSSDCNYTTYLRDATDDELRQAIEIMEAAPKGNTSRLNTCKRELARRDKSTHLSNPYGFATPSCFNCIHCFKLDEKMHSPQFINGKRIKPSERYCGFNGRGKKMVRIKARDIDKNHSFPPWCPLYKDATTCIECGKQIYSGQYITCKTCRRKGL